MALFFGLLAMQYFGFGWLFLMVVLMATVIPDLDTSKSRFGKKFWILRPIQWIAGHRKIFHSLIFVLVFGIGLWFIFPFVVYGFVFGYVLHLLLDCFTIQGVMLFYPFSEWRIKGFVKTSGWIEWGIFLIGFLGVVWIVKKLI